MAIKLLKNGIKISVDPSIFSAITWSPGGVLNFELGTDVRPEVSTTTL